MSTRIYDDSDFRYWLASNPTCDGFNPDDLVVIYEVTLIEDDAVLRQSLVDVTTNLGTIRCTVVNEFNWCPFMALMS